MAYILGSSLLFQLPIILICINRIKPLQPQKLFHYERWVILLAFVLSGLMNPTPNIISQLFVAGPFILMYQIGIAIIAITNRGKYSKEVQRLMEQDKLLREQRLTQAKEGLLVKAKSIEESIEAKLEEEEQVVEEVVKESVKKIPSVQRTLMGQPLSQDRVEQYGKHRSASNGRVSGTNMDFVS
jgi:uncharacterized protein YoxC